MGARRPLGWAVAGRAPAAGAGRTRRRTGRRGHPWFARCYAVLARVAEGGPLGRRRATLVALATGRVLDLGAGTGENFVHYRSRVASVVAVEPDRDMRRIGSRRIRRAPRPIRLVAATAEHLPFADDAFDTAVATLVLCSVDDLDAAVGELRRVLRPAAGLVVLEHVRAHSDGLARWQDRLERPWMLVAGGCRPNRRTDEALRRHGFDVANLTRFALPTTLPLVRPHVAGVVHPRVGRAAAAAVTFGTLSIGGSPIAAPGFVATTESGRDGAP